MRQISIKAKVSILFGIVFLLVCAFFVLSLKFESDSYFKKQSLEQENIIGILMSDYFINSKVNLYDFLKNRGFRLIEDDNYTKNLQEYGEELFKMYTSTGFYNSVLFEDKLFLGFCNQNSQQFFYNESKNTNFKYIFFGFIASLCLATFLYISIIRSLLPIKKLHTEIVESKHGYQIKLQNFQNDEIGKIAFEFANIVQKNLDFTESRQFFLRAIMHELKTPIGKGRIIAEMLKEEKQKERLVGIFERLDALINEASKLESLLSKNYDLQIDSYHFRMILDLTEKILMLDHFDQKVSVDIYSDNLYEVDIEIFALMLKNLIENAIKYSSDGHCYIENYNDYILIKNKGEPLKQDFKKYLEAFVREKNTGVDGMGLGLYIVDHICKIQNFKLEYEYKNSYHFFRIRKQDRK